MTPLGYQTLFELDINPGGTASYSRLGEGLESASPGLNEDIVQKGYLDGNGGKSTRSTGFQLIYAFSGERRPGNAAQDFIFGKMLEMGDARLTNFKVTGPAGDVITGACSIANIQPPGGDANSPEACGFEIHFNGKPSLTAKAAAAALTVTIAASAVTSGCTKATITGLGAGNHAAYKLSSAAFAIYGRQYGEGLTAYSSGADIPAVAGQYLTVYELDAYEHVVKATQQVLASGDIKV